MNVLFFIGNGFDKNLDIPTGYSDFYDYYLSKENDKNENVIALKDSIASDRNNWSDLEYQLGHYVAGLSSEKEANDLHVDIKTNLIEYLFSVTSGYSCKDSQRTKFYDDLKNPENYLLYDDKNTMISYKNREAYKNIRVMTFNYDYIFEMIANYNSSKVVIDSNHEITTVVHIHGTLDEGMIFGVDNEEQFHNQNLLKKPLINTKYIKSNYNKIARDGKEARCRAMIQDSHIIYMFGVSIGETDKRWWQYIVNRLHSGNCRLVIFWYSSQDLSNQQLAELWFLEQTIKDKLLSYSNLNETDKEIVKNRIFVKINSSFLRIQLENQG